MMGTRLRDRQADERLETLVEIARLDLYRHLTRAGATPRERLAVKAALRAALDDECERDAAAAIAEGESYSDVARAWGMTRQAVSKRYRHLEVVS